MLLWASVALRSTLSLQVLLTEEAGVCAGSYLRSGTASCPESAASHSWQSPEIVWEYHWVLAILPVWTNSRTLDKASLTTSDCELCGTHVQNPTVELCWIPGVLGRCYPSEARTHEQWVWGQLILGWIFILHRPSIAIGRYEISETLSCKKKKRHMLYKITTNCSPRQTQKRQLYIYKSALVFLELIEMFLWLRAESDSINSFSWLPNLKTGSEEYSRFF